MVTKDMKISEILNSDDSDKAVNVLSSAGMHCIGCPSSLMETLEEACMVHGLDVSSIIEQINK